MILGPILGALGGALSPGLAATGMFGNKAQGIGGNMLMGMSPIAMLMGKMLGRKKKKKAAAITVTSDLPGRGPAYGIGGIGGGAQPPSVANSVPFGGGGFSPFNFLR